MAWFRTQQGTIQHSINLGPLHRTSIDGGVYVLYSDSLYVDTTFHTNH
jgi:hypothetical protein